MTGVLLAGLASAEVPTMAADPYRISPGSVGALVTPGASSPEGFVATADVGWSRGALVWNAASGERLTLLEDAVGLTVSAWRGFGRGGIGVTAPLYVHLGGDLLENGPGLGDPGLEGRLTLWQGESAAVAAIGGVTLPMGQSSRLISDGAVGGQAMLLTAASVGGGEARLGLGYRMAPEVGLGDLILDDRITVRAAWVQPVGGTWSAAAELLGELSYQDVAAESIPLELLLSGHREYEGRLVRLGVGAGLLPGVGTPTWRLTAGIGQAVWIP